jgi:hypothetical protein
VPKVLRWSAGCTVVWAIYPLTNLYNRGALTEFFATGLLTCALLCLVIVFLSDEQRVSRRFASGAMFCLTLSAGTHPITALYGVPALAAIGVLLFFVLGGEQVRRRSKLKTLLPWALPSFLCLLPWYLAVRQHASLLRIQNSAVTFFGDSIDNIATRFFPVAHDGRVDDVKTFDPALTPYLDAQTNVPLLAMSVALIIVFFVHRHELVALRKRILTTVVVGTALFLLFTWLSLSPVPYTFLPATATMIQFAYRIVTYQNLALTMVVVLLLAFLARGGVVALARPATAVAGVLCVVLAATGVVLKWSHVAAVKQHHGSAGVGLSAHERSALAELPPTYYGWSDYSTAGVFQPYSPEDGIQLIAMSVRVNAKARFGKPELTRVSLEHEAWLHTNVLAFPWSRVVIDGNAVNERSLRVLDDRFVIRVPAGTHVVSTWFRAPTWWRFLRTLSILVIPLWLLSFLVPYRQIRRIFQRSGR